MFSKIQYMVHRTADWLDFIIVCCYSTFYDNNNYNLCLVTGIDQLAALQKSLWLCSRLCDISAETGIITAEQLWRHRFRALGSSLLLRCCWRIEKIHSARGSAIMGAALLKRHQFVRSFWESYGVRLVEMCTRESQAQPLFVVTIIKPLILIHMITSHSYTHYTWNLPVDHVCRAIHQAVRSVKIIYLATQTRKSKLHRQRNTHRDYFPKFRSI